MVADIFEEFEPPSKYFLSTPPDLRKDMFSGVYTNFSSFVALEHKFGLVYRL